MVALDLAAAIAEGVEPEDEDTDFILPTRFVPSPQQLLPLARNHPYALQINIIHFPQGETPINNIWQAHSFEHDGGNVHLLIRPVDFFAVRPESEDCGQLFSIGLV